MELSIAEQARKEIKEEQYRAAVEKEKDRLRRHTPFWKRVASLIPFTIQWRMK